jgi:hypothetical protein
MPGQIAGPTRVPAEQSRAGLAKGAEIGAPTGCTGSSNVTSERM